MPSKMSTAIAKGAGTLLEWGLLVLCFPCVCYCHFYGGRPKRAWYGTGEMQEWARRHREKFPRPPNPPPLPANRIDIRQLPAAEQPKSCGFFELPWDLRERIYEQVYGGRLITLRVVCLQYHEPCVIWSRCYFPVDDLAHDPTGGILPAEQISTALLRSCRQAYIEALPILHQRNTFHISTSQLDLVVRSGLGEYCLPDIRSVYLYHHTALFGMRSWKTDVFSLLQKMSLERVAFDFDDEGPPDAAEMDPYLAERDSSFGRCVLGLRNLRRLELWFRYKHVPNVRDSLDKGDLAEKLRKLMMAPGADERYRAFLEQYKI
ncbi:hypothetical protein MVEN_01078100 [Mycena venus]|uniref:DUF7730 domain-containing protein n=1 Tax=Mycena venus TaxID=2733690 RepID=A0A8H7CXH1_9AGAR|nr:hypothetical protein MVEN_01078100 [Mycena venus]